MTAYLADKGQPCAVTWWQPALCCYVMTAYLADKGWHVHGVGSKAHGHWYGSLCAQKLCHSLIQLPVNVQVACNNTKVSQSSSSSSDLSAMSLSPVQLHYNRNRHVLLDLITTRNLHNAAPTHPNAGNNTSQCQQQDKTTHKTTFIFSSASLSFIKSSGNTIKEQ